MTKYKKGDIVTGCVTGIEKYEDNIVYVKMLGACADCALIDITLKEGIEEIITSEIPEVKEVRLFEFE